MVLVEEKGRRAREESPLVWRRSSLQTADSFPGEAARESSSFQCSDISSWTLDLWTIMHLCCFCGTCCCSERTLVRCKDGPGDHARGLRVLESRIPLLL